MSHPIPPAVNSQGQPLQLPELRTLQKEALAAVFERYGNGVSEMLVHLATGVGKTVLGINLALRFPKTLFLVHQQELMHQTLKAWNHLVPEEKSSCAWKTTDLSGRFVVGMIQSVINRLDTVPKDEFQLVIVDECHHGGSASWLKVINHLKPALMVGLTATPERYDGIPLSKIFGEIVYSAGVGKAVEHGHLVQPIGFIVRTSVTISSDSIHEGDFDEEKLEREINVPERNRLVAENYLKHAKGRKAIGYGVTIKHAKELAETAQGFGIRADYIYGADPERQAKLEAHRDGELDVLFNSVLLMEGYDDSSISCVLWARPTLSRNRYVQGIGRGLRLHPGKKDCLVLDFVDSLAKQGLVGLWDFEGAKIKGLEAMEDKKEQTKIRHQELKEQGFPTVSYETYLTQAQFLIPPPRQQDERFMEQNNGQYSWHNQPPSEKQLALLQDLGYNPKAGWTRASASYAIAKSPAPKKWLQALMGMGYDVIGYEWTYESAKLALANGKKRLAQLQGTQ